MKIHVYLILTLIIIISGILGFLFLNRGHSWGDDFAQLIMQAESITTGTMDEFIEINTFIMNNSSNPLIGPITYPWGLPLLLSPVYSLFGRKILALKLINLIFYLLFLVSLFFFLRKRLKDFEALLLTCFFGINHVMLQSLNDIHGDIHFLFFVVLCIHLIDGYKNSEKQPNKGILIGFLIFWSYFLRGNGILLFIPLLYSQLSAFINIATLKDKIPAIVFNLIIPIFTFFFFDVAQSIIFPSGPSILLRNFEKISINSILINIEYYLWLPMSLFNMIPIRKMLYLTFFVFYFMSMFERKKRDLTIHLFVFSTMILYIFYPHWQGLRYIFPVLPYFVFFTYDGLIISIYWFKEKYQKMYM